MFKTQLVIRNFLYFSFCCTKLLFLKLKTLLVLILLDFEVILAIFYKIVDAITDADVAILVAEAEIPVADVLIEELLELKLVKSDEKVDK